MCFISSLLFCSKSNWKNHIMGLFWKTVCTPVYAQEPCWQLMSANTSSLEPSLPVTAMLGLHKLCTSCLSLSSTCRSCCETRGHYSIFIAVDRQLVTIKNSDMSAYKLSIESTDSSTELGWDAFSWNLQLWSTLNQSEKKDVFEFTACAGFLELRSVFFPMMGCNMVAYLVVP